MYKVSLNQYRVLLIGSDNKTLIISKLKELGIPAILQVKCLANQSKYAVLKKHDYATFRIIKTKVQFVALKTFKRYVDNIHIYLEVRVLIFLNKKLATEFGSTAL